MSIVFSDGMGAFPPVEQADENGLLAIGATLAADRLLYAYRHGIFPWYSDDEPICWYAPRERLVLFPNQLKVSKSFQKVLNAHLFRITMDTAFEEVIRACATVRRKGAAGTWIVEDMIAAYIQLHRLGYARSVEVWEEDRLVGGLYGVWIGKVFCGESMFSIVPNTSKIALHFVCGLEGIDLIDCQVPTDHLMSMGATIMDREDFMALLSRLVK